jgi:hypothetical protein
VLESAASSQEGMMMNRFALILVGIFAVSPGIARAPDYVALGVPSQNIPAGTFEALIAALVSDTTYANVHTTKFPAGEIRGQVQRGRGNGDKQ